MRSSIRAASALADLHDSYATRDHLGAALDDAALRLLLVIGMAMLAVFGGCFLGSPRRPPTPVRPALVSVGPRRAVRAVGAVRRTPGLADGVLRRAA